jgi:hypothetical protein
MIDRVPSFPHIQAQSLVTLIRWQGWVLSRSRSSSLGCAP